MDFVSKGLSRKATSEFGSNLAIIFTNMSYFSPDYSGFVRFPQELLHCSSLCIHKHISYLD